MSNIDYLNIHVHIASESPDSHFEEGHQLSSIDLGGFAADKNNYTAITAKDVWKILEGVKRGSFHVQVGWCDLKTAASVATSPSSIISKSEGTTIVVGPSSTYALHRGVLSVRIDSCCNLLAVGGGSGGHSGGTRREQLRNLRSFVKAELCGASQATEIAIGGENPIFEHKVGTFIK